MLPMVALAVFFNSSKSNIMSLIQLVIDFSDLRESQLPESEKEKRKEQLRAEFRIREQQSFDEQSRDIAGQVAQMKPTDPRTAKALDKLWRFSWGVSTYRQALQENRFVGKYISVENAVKYNRVKYNRSGPGEQEAYEARMNVKKTVYHLALNDERSLEVSKLVFDWANLPQWPDRDYYTKF